jgi:hypothetical protein
MSASADVSQVIAKLEEHQKLVREAALLAVDQFAEMVLTQAAILCPVDTGFLAASGTAERAELNGHVVSVLLGFNASYAAAVHERLDVHHEQGQAKFLETAIRNMAPKFGPYVANAIKRATGE